MKILIRNSDAHVLFAGDDLQLDTNEVAGNGWTYAGVNSSTATLGDAALPPLWTGAVWSYANGVWAVVDTDRYAQIVSAYRLSLIAQCDTLAKAKRDAIVANISPAEMAGWSIKRAEARTFTASGIAADAQTLEIEATSRGVTLAALVVKVLAKATLFASLEAQIAGSCGKHQDAIALLPLADVADYDITMGWPV